MRTEDLKRLVLMTLGNREFYGYEVQKELTSKSIKVGTSRLYRVLTDMLREGLLEGRWEKSQLGPQKRVYSLGEMGKKEREKILLGAIETVHGFYSEYLLNLPPEADVFNILCKLLSRHLTRKGSVGYVTPEFSVTHEKLLFGLHKTVPEGKVYLVKPNSLAVGLNLNNLLFLDGTFDNIPLKDRYLDLLIVVEVPSKDSLEICLREWHRVLKQGGTLAISTPTVLVHRHEDPMSIGNFMERVEHETLGKGEDVDGDFLKALLKKFFHKVEKRQIVHMTIFLASGPLFPIEG